MTDVCFHGDSVIRALASLPLMSEAAQRLMHFKVGTLCGNLDAVLTSAAIYILKPVN